MALRHVVVVGGSLAGLSAAEGLRAGGFDGRITIVGADRHEPYDRPPLSKQYLAGTWERDRVALRDPAKLDAIHADWRRGVVATGLDVAARTVRLDDGTSVAGDGVVIATGAAARTLPFADGVPGAHVLRTLDDAQRLRADLEPGGRRVVVIGAGFIGAEVAATARERGHEVTILEALPVPMARAVGPDVGMACAEIQRDHGVDVRLGVGVEGLVTGDGRVRAVTLADGSEVPADVVVVGIGARPETGWLEGSGLTIDDGVVCDDRCTAAPGIVAAGDVCRFTHNLFGEVVRIEHWDNAVEQGRYCAAALLDPDGVAPYAPVPFFWSDQYDRKLQMVGRPGPRVEIVHGSVEERRFVALYGRDDVLVGAFGMNRPRQVMLARTPIGDRQRFDDALAAARG